jgi:hypothetical protein
MEEKMIIRPWIINQYPNNYLPKLRILDEYAHMDLIDGTTEEVMPEYKNIKALYHFTPIWNIPSILEHGLLSRDQCEDTNNIIFYNIYGKYTDKDRYDGRKDCISCSINKPYFNMLSDKRRIMKKYGGITILRIQKEIINKSNYALFVNGNAAEKENAKKTYEELNDPNNILDGNNEYKSNSEILIKDHIPLDYIESFNFSIRDLSSYNWAECCKFYSGKCNVRFYVNNKMFGKYYSE